MLEIHIETVENGAVYQNKIYDFWIIGSLKDGQSVKIFDSVPFKLNKHARKKLNLLVLAQFIQLESIAQKTNISGEFIGKYTIPHAIGVYQNGIYQKEWMGLKNENGIFLLNPTEFSEFAIKQGEIIHIRVGRFDLVGVQ